MSILRSKHSGWTHEGRRTPYFGGGGGGGPAQTTSTSYSTNIPEYARPYVETMLGATQRQLFDIQDGEITGFRPYQPYSTDPTKYVAGFQPLQQQAMRATGQLRTPTEYGAATGLAGAAGLGGLGLAGQMARTGEQFAMGATDPRAVQAYMSPYMQNVVDYQKAQALRDFSIGQPMRRAQAVGQGAFGGSRQAIMEAEAERNLMSQLQGITATGSQKAFEDAQRQQQFGAQLGLQGQQAALGGLGAATQAAGALGQLGGQQLGAQKDIIGLQSQMGAMQQAREQQIINQAIQDWANTQQYPLMQLGVMSNMLRGLPMQSATTQQYVAAPNALTQGIGTIGALGSLGNVFRGGKEGGLPSEFKKSDGIMSFRKGGVSENVEDALYDMDEDGLQQYIQTTTSDTARKMARRILREKTGPSMASGGIVAFQAGGQSRIPTFAQDVLTMPQGDLPVQREESKEEKIMREYRERLAAEADRVTPYQKLKGAIGRAQEENLKRATVAAGGTPTPAPAAAPAAAAPAPAPAPAGITTVPGTSTETNVPQTPPPPPAPAGVKAAAPAAPAPATGRVSTDNPELYKYIERTLKEANAPEKSVSELAAERRAYIGPDEATAKERSRLMAERVSAKDEATRQNWMRMAEFFAAWGSTPGNSIVAGLTALKAKIPDFITDAKEQKKILKEIDGSIYNLDKVERLEKAGEFDKASELKQKLSADLKGRVGNIITYEASKYGADTRLKEAQIRAEGGGGGDDKMLNNLIARRTAIQNNISKVRSENKILVQQAEMQNPANKPEIEAMKKKAQADLNAKLNAQGLLTELDQVNALINQYSRVQAAGAVSGQPGAAVPAPASGSKLVKNKDGSFDFVPQQ